MQFLLGVDYELFFGNPTGTPQACMIEPTNALLDVLEKHGARLTAFADAAYLVKLQQARQRTLRTVFERIARQLRTLVDRQHDVQLHVHPHWQDSNWREGRWQIDTQRYRAHDFSREELIDMLREQVACLGNITGSAPVAYRAGGWCLQPFAHLSEALHAVGIRLDSTVYAGGSSVNPGREFDFTRAPLEDYWRFEDDPLVVEASGRFLELPISTVTVPPIFYWRMLGRRLRPSDLHRTFGDGKALSGSGGYYLRKLLAWESGVASIDGARASMLPRALAARHRLGGNVLNVMGHPKSISRASLRDLDAFLQAHGSNFDCHTMSSFLRLHDQVSATNSNGASAIAG